MAYIPPQKRNKMTKSSMITNDFPQLAQPKLIKETTLDFKKLFKNVEIKRKQRENRIKHGWIKLTKEGLIDSFSAEQREEDNKSIEWCNIQYNMNQLVQHWEHNQEMRLERDGYLSDYSVEPPSEEEEEEDIEESEEEFTEEEDEDIVDSKWLTS